MFELPATKRVKRTEVFQNDTGDARSDEDLSTDELQANFPAYTFDYEIREVEPKPTNVSNQSGLEPEFESFQFNLFKPTSRPVTTQVDTVSEVAAQSAPQLISIRSPSPVLETSLAEAQFQKSRPESYYLTAAVSLGTQKRLHEEYASSAVAIETINAQSKLRWPGTSLSWRVVNLPCHKRQTVLHKTGHDTNVGPVETALGDKPKVKLTPRARPSKKRRLLIRAKTMKRQRIIDESKTKEEHEREKKSKKNRERKLKRRAKEREEKAAKSGVTEEAMVST